MKPLESLLIPIFSLALVIAYAYDVKDIRNPTQNLKLAAPVLVLLATCAVTILISTVREAIRNRAEFAAQVRQHHVGQRARGRMTEISLPVIAVGYLSLLPYAGVVASTTAAILLIFLAMRRRIRLFELAYGLGFGILIFFVFGLLLGRNLPGHF